MTNQSDPTQEVLRTWDGIAPAWERHRERLFESLRSVSDWLVEAIAPSPGQIVLELAAGPGGSGPQGSAGPGTRQRGMPGDGRSADGSPRRDDRCRPVSVRTDADA